MERAIELSIENAKNRQGGPFGATIVKDGVIISEGTNMVTMLKDPSGHAEVIAIRKACKELNTHDLTGCEIYTSCCPCSMCFACIRWARIDKIYYANTREDAHDIGFSDLEIHEELKHIMNGCATPNFIHIKNDKAIEAFKIWENDKDKIKY